MMAFVRKLLPPILLVLVSVVGGWQVTCLIDMFPSNMPYAVDMFIRFGPSATGHEELTNGDDIPALDRNLSAAYGVYRRFGGGNTREIF